MEEKFNWKHFLITEQEFIKSEEYLSIEESNFEATSLFLQNQITVLGAKIESSFKRLCSFLDDSKEMGNLTEYKECILTSFPNLPKYKTTIMVRDVGLIAPFEAWNKSDGKIWWWAQYTDIKHGRNIEKSRPTLKLALYMLSAYLILITHIHSEEAAAKGENEFKYYDIEEPKLMKIYEKGENDEIDNLKRNCVSSAMSYELIEKS